MEQNACRSACAPSANGCLRCGPAGQTLDNGVLLIVPRDADADVILSAAFATADWQTSRMGPLLVVHDVRLRLSELAAHLRATLAPHTLSSARAAYAGQSLDVGDLLASLAFAEPLDQLLGRLEHEWVRDLIAGDRLFSMFHPIIDVHHGGVFAQEALIRAVDPSTGKTIGAGPIIAASLALDIEHQFDQRARVCAIRDGARVVPLDQKLFINFLPNTIYDPAVCLRTTILAATEHGIDLSRLVFEVVESQKIPDMKRLLAILEFYRKRGVGTAIDDMGAGFANLDYITQLRPDFVKLDREFMLGAIADLEKWPEFVEVVRTSHAVGAQVIAEGIETEMQMVMCREAGVDFLQGFLFARPSARPEKVTLPAGFHHGRMAA